MGFAQYNPKKVIVSFLNTRILGFANDTKVEIAFREDGVTDEVGVDGDVVRVLNNNQLADVTINLLEASPSNGFLQVRYNQDRQFGTSFGPFSTVNTQGTLLVTAENSWIKKVANVSYGKDTPVRQWTITLAEAIVRDGGALIF